MAENRDAVSENVPKPSTELFISKHPRANGVICVILALVLAGASVVCLSLSGSATALLGPGLACVLLALLSALIAVLAFQLARRPSGALALLGPLRLFAIFTFVFGVAGAALGMTFGAIAGAPLAVGAGVGTFLVSLIVVTQGALIYGAATARLPATPSSP